MSLPPSCGLFDTGNKTKNYCRSELIIIWLNLCTKPFLSLFSMLYSCTEFRGSLNTKLRADVNFTISDLHLTGTSSVNFYKYWGLQFVNETCFLVSFEVLTAESFSSTTNLILRWYDPTFLPYTSTITNLRQKYTTQSSSTSKLTWKKKNFLTKHEKHTRLQNTKQLTCAMAMASPSPNLPRTSCLQTVHPLGSHRH